MEHNNEASVSGTATGSRWSSAVKRLAIGWLSDPSTNSHTGYISAERAVRLIAEPASACSVSLYIVLIRLLRSREKEWLSVFLEHHGLQILFDNLEAKFTEEENHSLYSVLLQAYCVECMREVMDNQTSLEYIIENEEFIERFATALGNPNVAVKKQVLEILAAISVYSKDGYARALQVLEKFKTTRQKKYRFSVILEELRASDNVAYSTILLEFLNCLIIYSHHVEDRIRIRNEFFGLRLQEVLNTLKKEGDPDVLVQVQLFEEHQSTDEEALPGIDLSSPLDVFHAILKQVCDTPQELQFLTVLQHLLKIDASSEALSQAVWDAVEQLVHKATVLESPQDAAKLLTATTRRMEVKAGQDALTSPRHRNGRRSSSPSTEQSPSSVGTPAPAPPPPPPPPPVGAPPPPPPGGVPPAPPPPPGTFRSPSGVGSSSLPQQSTPKPRNKLRKLQWQKIPLNNIVNKDNVWTMVGKLCQKYEMDYQRMDELFAVTVDAGSKRPGQASDGTPESKRKKETTEINLLDGKRSLNVNIFLKQFRMSHQDIVSLLQEGRSDQFGAERLKGLLKQLPSQDEIDLLKGFDGDKDKLGNAEKFFLCLMALPNFRMRIEGLLTREEFNSNMEWIRPSIEALIQAAKDIKESKSLQELIFFILMTGNYLNSGNNAGNAAGFKLSSLLKLTEIRANKPRMNLLHYVVTEAEEKNPRLLHFPEEMTFLKEAAQVSLEGLTSDVNALTSKVKAITEQIGRAGEDFQKQMAAFLKEANVEVKELEEDLKDIEGHRKDLAIFFSEDSSTFKIEDCFKTLQSFCERFKKAIDENKQRKVMEEKAEQKRRQKEADQQRNSKDMSEPQDQTLERASSPEEGSIVDMLLADVRSGFCNRKYTEGAFNVTKVQKINLDASSLAAALTSGTGGAAVSVDEAKLGGSDPKDFVRRGYGRVSLRKKKQEGGEGSMDTSTDSVGNDSLMQKRSRKSYATEDDASLIEFLMDSELEPDRLKPETSFDNASMRRRRQERRERRSLLEVMDGGRERAASPVINSEGKVTVPATPPQGQLKGVEGATQREQGGAEVVGPSRTLRRTRSWLDRPSVEKALAATQVKAPAREDETDALLVRIKNRLRGDKEQRDPRTSSPSPVHEEPLSVPRPASAPPLNSEDTPRARADHSRWRSGITSGSEHHSLEPISEKDGVQTSTDTAQTGQTVATNVSTTTQRGPDSSTLQTPDTSRASEAVVLRHESRLERSRRQMKQRYSSVDPANLSKLLNSEETAKALATSQDDSDLAVSVSMRKAMSDKNGINLDGLLKTIENSDRPIENFGVISPSKRQQPEVTVAATVSEVSQQPDASSGEPPELKQKREKRKKRSTLVLDDVHAALRGIPKPADTTDRPQESVSEDLAPADTATSLPSPSPHSRLHTNDKTSDTEKSKEEKEAAKQAAKKNFRDARFGYKDMKSVSEINGRCRSDVERQDVDQALKDLASMGNMSRSKSYDESVARRASTEGEQTMRNSGSTPNTTEEKKSLLRGSSTNRLSMDGRRNGLYIPSDDSDTELRAEDKNGSRRSSSAKSDSPKSVSRLSVKSANTSTETLQAEKDSDGDSSPEQRRRSYAVEEPSDTVAAIPRPASTTAVELVRTGRRSYSYMDRAAVETAVNRLQTKVDQLEDEDNPMASVAKWRLKRTKRWSVYDNVMDTEGGSPSPRGRASVTEPPSASQLLLQRADVLDYKNEVGSRSSYASSYASSTDTDQGFESMGNVSQRTSLSSTLESEITGTPTLGRKTDSAQRNKRDSVLEDSSNNSSMMVNSSLSEEDSRKQRTETWTEEALRVTAGQGNTATSDPTALSPDSGHSTSKEDLWSEGGSPSHNKGPAPSPPPVSHTPQVTVTPTPSEASRPKSRPIPSYMRSTNSSARARAAPSPSSTEAEGSFRRDTAARKSFRAKDSSLRRDSGVRASMRAESAFRRQSHTSPRATSATARDSAPPSSSSPSRSLAPPASRARSDSNASCVSSISSTSDVSSASTSKMPSPRKLTAGPGDSARSTTPSARAIPRATTPSSGLSRTQSMRVTSTRTSLGTGKADRASTPLHHEKRSVTPLSHETKRPGTPSSDSSTASRRRSHHMEPTASSKAHQDHAATSDSSTPKAPPRSKSRFMEPTASSRAAASSIPTTTSPTPPPRTRSSGGKEGNVLNSLTRHGSLRMPRTSSRLTSSELPKADSSPKMAGSSKKGAPMDLEHPLDTVTENIGAEELEDTVGDGKNKSPSLLKRIGIVKGKEKTSSNLPTKKTVIVSSAQARAGQDRKK